MNRALLPFVKSLFVAMLAVSSIASSVATEAKQAEAVKAADPVKGEALYANGDSGRNIPACASCHGAAGNSTIAQNPKLAAQHAAYLNKQLSNFTGAERNNPVMTTFAKLMTQDDMKNVAAYLSKQVAKPGAAKNKETIEAGKKIYRAGIVEKNVPACAGCHSPNGAGIPAQFPRIAGQHQDYTVAQLTSFRIGARKNSPQMEVISKRMSDEEMKAVADYVAGLK